jgi:intein/homing endonuclease
MRNYIKKNLPKPNHNYFESIDSERKAYFLGLIVADGCVIRTSSGSFKKSSDRLVINLQEKDKYVLEEINKDITPYKKLLKVFYENRCWQNQFRFKVHSNKICKDLENLGIKPRKSGNEVFPILDLKMIPHFIRGFMDGDGCVYQKLVNKTSKNPGKLKNRIIFTSLSHQFLKDLQSNLKGIGTILEVKRKTPRQNVFNYTISGFEDIKYFYKLIYENSTIFLQRKKDNFLDIYKQTGIW